MIKLLVLFFTPFLFLNPTHAQNSYDEADLNCMKRYSELLRPREDPSLTLAMLNYKDHVEFFDDKFTAGATTLVFATAGLIPLVALDAGFAIGRINVRHLYGNIYKVMESGDRWAAQALVNFTKKNGSVDVSRKVDHLIETIPVNFSETFCEEKEGLVLTQRGKDYIAPQKGFGEFMHAMHAQGDHARMDELFNPYNNFFSFDLSSFPLGYTETYELIGELVN